MQSGRRPLILVALAAVGSLAVLVAARPPIDAATLARGDDLALAVAWAVAVIASTWLFLVTGSCLVALVTSRPRLARRLALVLPSGIRRLVEVAIVASCVALPALPAYAAGPVTAVIIDQPVVRGPAVPPPIIPRPVVAQPVVAQPVVAQPVVRSPPAPSEPAAVAPAPEHVVVRPGDNLWLIARAVVARHSAAAPSDAHIGVYWRAVIAANRPTLRSGDPSLIFPGEVITLPAPTDVS